MIGVYRLLPISEMQKDSDLFCPAHAIRAASGPLAAGNRRFVQEALSMAPAGGHNPAIAYRS